MLNSGIEQKAILFPFRDSEMGRYVITYPIAVVGDLNRGVLSGELGIRRVAPPFSLYT